MEGIKAVVKWQQNVMPGCHNHRFFRLGQPVECGSVGPVFVSLTVALAPLRNRLGVDAQLAAQLRERSFRSARIAALTA